jgi:hypothetical protein
VSGATATGRCPRRMTGRGRTRAGAVEQRSPDSRPGDGQRRASSAPRSDRGPRLALRSSADRRRRRRRQVIAWGSTRLVGLETPRAWPAPLRTTSDGHRSIHDPAVPVSSSAPASTDVVLVRAHSRSTWLGRSAALAGIGRRGEAEAAWSLGRQRRCEIGTGRDRYGGGPHLVQGVPASRLGTADRRRPGMEATWRGSALAHPARRDADDRRCSSPRCPPIPSSATCFAASAASAALRVRQALGTTPPIRSRRCRPDRNLPPHVRVASDC